MSEVMLKLIELLKTGKTHNEICDELGISSKQLANYMTILRNKGFLYNRNFYYDGKTLYKPVDTRSSLEHAKNVSNENVLLTTPEETELKFLVISDLHFGNEAERLDLVNRAYNYCVKNGINVVFCCGDLIDGTFTRGKQYIKDPSEQIEHFIKDFPYDKNILVFGVGGDHDYSVLQSKGQDIIEILKNYRHDIIIGDYGLSYIDIKNAVVKLAHKSPTKLEKKFSVLELNGHFHHYKTNKVGKKISIDVPALSNVINVLPSVIEMTLQFNKGYINNVTLKQICFLGNDTFSNDALLSEVNYPLSMPANLEPISNETQPEEEILSSEMTSDSPLSTQVQKFYKKWGNNI